MFIWTKENWGKMIYFKSNKNNLLYDNSSDKLFILSKNELPNSLCVKNYIFKDGTIYFIKRYNPLLLVIYKVIELFGLDFNNKTIALEEILDKNESILLKSKDLLEKMKNLFKSTELNDRFYFMINSEVIYNYISEKKNLMISSLKLSDFIKNSDYILTNDNLMELTMIYELFEIYFHPLLYKKLLDKENNPSLSKYINTKDKLMPAVNNINNYNSFKPQKKASVTKKNNMSINSFFKKK